MITINTEIWHWPQWTTIVLIGLATLIEIDQSGRPRRGTYSAVFAIFRAALWVCVLADGGFFG